MLGISFSYYDIFLSFFFSDTIPIYQHYNIDYGPMCLQNIIFLNGFYYNIHIKFNLIFQKYASIFSAIYFLWNLWFRGIWEKVLRMMSWFGYHFLLDEVWKCDFWQIWVFCPFVPMWTSMWSYYALLIAILRIKIEPVGFSYLRTFASIL